MRKPRQPTLFPLPLPKHVQVVVTTDLDLSTREGIRACVERMFAVPLDKSLLLDFLVGYRRGGGHASEEHLELHRLQSLLNSRVRGKRFDFLGDSLAARLMRHSIREGEWIPAFKR